MPGKQVLVRMQTIFGPKFLNPSIVYMKQGKAPRLFLSDNDEKRLQGVQTQYAGKNNTTC